MKFLIGLIMHYSGKRFELLMFALYYALQKWLGICPNR